MIDQFTIERIQSAAQIVEVVSKWHVYAKTTDVIPIHIKQIQRTLRIGI